MSAHVGTQAETIMEGGEHEMFPCKFYLAYEPDSRFTAVQFLLTRQGLSA